ncbi:amino acid ABC transporter permease [Spelaeicoccus albus]|uniref:Glutamate transport system permease protein n=1 Tax=Spelaeicoccus albus TaxID=1280376 RepID=A0A7Z0D124_9MICO|nr:amino acid ABC transporter permease [Spelaeicoccus albus]NYI66218.1 glutamate transport system permease protein [Spelaeicoccus albus]
MTYLADFAGAFGLTIRISAFAFAMALILGTIVALCRVSAIPPLRAVGTFYVEVVRNIPLLVLLILIVFALPEAGVKFTIENSAIIGLGIYEASYVCEAVRSGINSIPLGQAEAARAIGLPTKGVLGHVIVPQALRSVVQPLGNIAIATVLNSSLAAAVGVVELTGVANILSSQSSHVIVLFIGDGAAYFALTLVVGFLAGRLDKKVAIRR